jgi:hypothetical protein
VLATFQNTEAFVKRALNLFRYFLTTLPSAPDARKEQLDKIRKLGCILWVKLGVLDTCWVEFLREQCIVDHDDLD